MGDNRHIERRAGTDPTNLVYLCGMLDEQVGDLADDETAFGTNHGDAFIDYNGNHGTPDTVTRDALATAVGTDTRARLLL